MVRWYLEHAMALSVAFFVAGVLLPTIGPTLSGVRGSLRRPSRAEWIWGAVLIAEAAVQFSAWSIFTDPDAFYYGINWPGINRFAFLAIATPVGALVWHTYGLRRSRPAV